MVFAVGALKNFVSGHPLFLSTDTIKYLFRLLANLNGPAKFIANSSSILSGIGTFPKCFCFKTVFIDLPVSWHS